MAIRRTSVGLEDAQLAALDALAASLGCSRSALVRRAVGLLLQQSDSAAVDAAIVRGYEETPPAPDPWQELAARTAIQAESW